MPRSGKEVETPQPAIPLQDIYNYSKALSEKTSLAAVEQTTSSIYSGYEKVPAVPKKWPSLSSLAKTRPAALGSLSRSKTFTDKVDKKKEQPYTGSVDNIMTAVMYNGYHKKDHALGGKEDKLPVVELKPFISSTKKEWRPSRSWAWGEEPITHQNIQNLSSSVDSLGYPDLHKLETTPRFVEEICAKAFQLPCERKALHPKVKDVADGTVIQKEVSFVPKVEREKTTVEEIKNATMYGQYSAYGYISREMTEVDVRRHQKIQVHGSKMDKGNTAQNKYYQKRWEKYQSKSAVEKSHQVEKQEVTSIVQTNGKENTYLDNRIYDCFDRATTLPSITVKAVSQNKKPKPVKEPAPRKKSARFGLSPGYRLGVVNSLDVMSMCGKPLKIEQNLTNHLKSTLEQIKRTKDTSFLPPKTTTSEKIINQKMEIGSVPTIGEMHISEARRSNGVVSSQSAPVYRSKSLKSTSDVRNLSRATTMYNDSGFEGSSDHRLSPTKSSQWSTKLPQNHSKHKVNHGVILKRTTRAERNSNKKDTPVDLVPQNSTENMEIKPVKSARKSGRTSSSAIDPNVDKDGDRSSLDDSIEIDETPTQQESMNSPPGNGKEIASVKSSVRSNSIKGDGEHGKRPDSQNRTENNIEPRATSKCSSRCEKLVKVATVELEEGFESPKELHQEVVVKTDIQTNGIPVEV